MWRCHSQGLDIRYVVTNIAGGGAQWLYESLYCGRGQAENLIKLHKTQLSSDRTSCRSPLANQVRLVLRRNRKPGACRLRRRAPRGGIVRQPRTLSPTGRAVTAGACAPQLPDPINHQRPTDMF
jgi:hypothetical protein